MRFYNYARRVVRPTGTLAVALAAAGCSTDMLNVSTPNVLADAAVSGSLGATTIRNGALRSFATAFSGTQDGFVVTSGNLGDEIQTTDTFADRYNTDQRVATENLGGAINTTYTNLQLARTGLSNAIEKWRAAKPDAAAPKDSLSELYSVRSYTETMFAEGYCAGVPFSRVLANGDFEYGDPLTTVQMFTRSEATADSALSNATGATYRSLAQIAKGRALLNRGQFAAAAQAVAGVPTSFRYQIFHSIATTGQNNGIWQASFVAGNRYNVGTKEGVNGIDYLVTPADPRVPWAPSTRTGFDGTSRNLPQQQKYTSQGAPATLADGIEARLIEAEALLNRTSGGSQADRDAMFAALNQLRATGLSTAIPALAAAPTTQAAAVDMLFKERAYWLWLTGHRLGDMRRLIRQYGRTAATVFPTGAMLYRPGNSYGTDVNLVIPIRERNNPKFQGCIDRNP
jgi:starch-binding outer membrane protein, SusD/RagB family